MTAESNRRSRGAKSRLFRLVSLLVMVLLISACGYHFAGSATNSLAPGQSLWVAFIENETDLLTAQTTLRRALLEEGHVMRSLYPASSAESAALRINGKFRSIASSQVSYSSKDQVKQFRLTIDVELELFRKGETAPIWKGTLQAFQEYPANSNDLALQRSSEQAALIAASQILAQKLLIAVEQVY
jgi:outer membrane lipopolysaccharide assembly protein LptE/RlpB